MKKLFAILIALAILVPVVACASNLYVDRRYTLFIDGNLYNAFFSAGFDFETQIIDIYFLSDYKSAYYCKQEWKKDSGYTSTGMVDCTFSYKSGKFYLTFPDGSYFEGYDDENEEDLWLNLGGGTFKFILDHSFDIQKDWKGK